MTRQACLDRTSEEPVDDYRVRAVAAQNILRRADRMIAALDGDRVVEKGARVRVMFPTPAACGRTPLVGKGLTKTFGSLEVFNGVDLSIDRGSRVVVLGRNGGGKTTLLRLLAGVQTPDAGRVERGHGLKIGYLAQDNDTLDSAATVWDHIWDAAPDADEQDLRRLLGSLMFGGPQLAQRMGSLSGGERTRLALTGLVASRANVLLLDEPTNNLDPTSREQVLDALRSYVGAVVLVTHDPMVAEALDPQRVMLLPEGIEDLWSEDYRISSNSPDAGSPRVASAFPPDLSGPNNHTRSHAAAAARTVAHAHGDEAAHRDYRAMVTSLRFEGQMKWARRCHDGSWVNSA